MHINESSNNSGVKPVASLVPTLELAAVVASTVLLVVA